MPEVRADPEEIEELARQLAVFVQETREGLSRVGGRLREMGHGSWQDARHQEFEGMFGEVEAAMARALEETEGNHVPYLHAVAARLRQYLDG